jgi:hypothetical protein
MLSDKEIEDIDGNRERLRKINKRAGVRVVRSLLDEWEAEQEAAQAMREDALASGADLPLFSVLSR